MSKKNIKREKIKKRIRKKIIGTSSIPRLSIYKSNQRMYASLIDDNIGKVITSVCSVSIGARKKNVNLENSEKTGVLIGEKAKSFNIKKVVFDRSGYIYHGRVKALAIGARKAGLIF